MKNICITIPTIRWSEPTISVTEQIESQNEQNRNKPSSKEKCQQWSIRKNGTVSVQVSLSSPASFLQLYKLSPGLSKNERYWYHPINLSTIPWPEVSDCTFTNKLNRDRSRSWDCITISSSCLHSPSHNFGSCSRPEDHSGRGCTYSQYGQKFHGEESLAPPHWFLWGLRYGLQFALFTRTNIAFFFLILCWTLFCECVFMKHVQAHMSDSIPVNRKSCIASEFPTTSYTQIVWWHIWKENQNSSEGRHSF